MATVEKLLKKVAFTSWCGRYKAFISVPQTKDMEFQKAIVNFLMELDDHDALTELVKFWNLEDGWQNRFYGYQPPPEIERK